MDVESQPPRKRARVKDTTDDTISCAECRQRKVSNPLHLRPLSLPSTVTDYTLQTRCDRAVPCGACVRRGLGDSCTPEVRKPNPPGLREVARHIHHMQDRLDDIVAFLTDRLGYTGSCFELEHAEPLENPSTLMARPPGASLGPEAVRTASEIAALLQGTSRGTDLDILADSAAVSSASSSPQQSENLRILSESTQPSFSTLETYPFPSILSRTTRSSWQRVTLSSILASLPATDDLRYLSQLYFRMIGWQVHAVLQRQVAAELEELDEIVRNRRTMQIDPAWLALIFIVSKRAACAIY